MNWPPLIRTLLLAALTAAVPAWAGDDGFSARIDEVLGAADHPDLHNHDLHPEQDVLRALYAQRGDAPLWQQSGAASAPAQRLLRVLQNAADYGLEPAVYEPDLLARKLAELQSDSTATAASWADWDVALSTAALRFVRQLHYGRIDPHRAGFDLDQPRAALDLPATLTQLAAADDPAASLAAIEPRFHHYQLLKAALARYRQLAADPGLTALPDFAGRSVKPGEAYAGAADLRRRLALLGDLPDPAAAAAATDDALLDQSLVQGLTSFQQRHGLQADGVLGKATLQALNMPLAFRVRQIELTLERWRWLPDLAPPWIAVNIPQYRLFAFTSDSDQEQGMLNMEVVVGQDFPEKRTPVFLGKVQYVVFRPYWDVPYSITQREILPMIRSEPGYLKRTHMELVQGPSDDSPVVPATPQNIALLGSGKVRLRQQPGPDNALGEIKFMLPNRYNVYLHSTPAQELFTRAKRAFSHGCIRVSDPQGLAAFVLRNAPGEWTAETIAAAMNGAPNQRVTLKQPVQVMILYGTVMATESGRVYFLDDLYGHDRNLEQLLGLAPIAAAR